ncbi:hypothetical protein DU002_18220 [Corallincola holothuriorum]|uniref:Lipoprotein n=1 Tax=Corallincola holothuriorum TaxID=2282215 RepID=A0A368MZX6_9GAMM|nr:hypothetical protein [Corallincola holothuriorum]RCU43817.1 hypothetical protein DU002_18220 [Corallincola holothuriorum]
MKTRTYLLAGILLAASGCASTSLEGRKEVDALHGFEKTVFETSKLSPVYVYPEGWESGLRVDRAVVIGKKVQLTLVVGSITNMFELDVKNAKGKFKGERLGTTNFDEGFSYQVFLLPCDAMRDKEGDLFRVTFGSGYKDYFVDTTKSGMTTNPVEYFDAVYKVCSENTPA